MLIGRERLGSGRILLTVLFVLFFCSPTFTTAGALVETTEENIEIEEVEGTENPNEIEENEDQEETITIADPALRAAIQEEIEKNGDTIITTDSLAKITKLEKIRDKEISSLDGIEHLINLKVLELRNNNISDLTPLQSLSHLKEIDLRENKITSLLSLSSMARLEVIDLRGNDLNTIAGIENLHNLKELDIRSNHVTDLTPVKNLLNLEKLDIRENGVTVISDLEKLLSLKELSARGNSIKDLTPLEGMKQLKELNLHSNLVEDLQPISGLTNLEVLIIRRNKITDITPLKKLLLLNDLNLRDNDIVDISPLANHEHLTVRLNLDGNSRLTDFSPIAHYYDAIKDVDFVLPADNIDVDKYEPIVGPVREAYLLEEIRKHNTHIIDEAIRTSKFTAMTSGAFPFYRGTAHLFFSDVKNGTLQVPELWTGTGGLNTWITGDLHTENIGFYGNRDKEAVFELNDYDEAAIAPFYYDLLNFGTSLYLLNDASPGLQLSEEESLDIVKAYGNYYKEAIHDVANGTINPDSFYFTADKLDGFVGKLAKEVSEEPLNGELNSWTTLTSNGDRVFAMSNVRLAEATVEDKREIIDNWDSYLNQLDPSIIEEYGEDYFNIKDIVRRVNAGLGSLGYDRYYVLIEGESNSENDDIILDIKEQASSAVDESGIVERTYDSHAARTIDGVFAMHNNRDIHWGSLQGKDKSYLVKERSPFKEEFSHADFGSAADLDNFVKYSAKVTAYAHSRAAKTIDNPNFAKHLSNLLQNEWDSFAADLAQVSIIYYTQVVSDQKIYAQLERDGAFNLADDPLEEKPEEDPVEPIEPEEEEEEEQEEEENPEEKTDPKENENELGSEKDEELEPKVSDEDSAGETKGGSTLPNTATNIYQIILWGALIILSGVILLFKRRKLN